MLGRRKQYHFGVVVRLHNPVAVSYVNAVTFSKLRLLDTCHTSQYSASADLRNHTFSWNTEHRFRCKFRSKEETNVLVPKFFKLFNQNGNTGKEIFYKVGFGII